MKFDDKFCFIFNASSKYNAELINLFVNSGVRTTCSISSESIFGTNKTFCNETEVFECEFTNFSQIEKLAKKIIDSCKAIDYLIINTPEFCNSSKVETTVFEYNFVANFLAPLFLVKLLITRLKEKSRIICVLPEAFAQGTINYVEIDKIFQHKQLSSPALAKLVKILFIKKIASLFSEKNITANCILPGNSPTNSFSDANLLVKRMLQMSAVKTSDIALNIFHLSTAAEFENISGKYFEKRKQIATLNEANDLDLASALWDLGISCLQSALNGS